MDSKATQLSATDAMTLLAKKGSEYDQKTETGPMGRSVKLAAGEAPKGAMIDGPFGGKKPA